MLPLALTLVCVFGAADAGTPAATEQQAEERAPVVTVAPGTPRPGDLLLITFFSSEKGKPPAGTLAGKPLHFFSFKKGYRALAPLSVDQPLGPLSFEIVPAGAKEPISHTVDVIDPRFRESELKVANKFVSPPKEVKAQIAQDKREFSRAYNQPFVFPLFKKNFRWPRPPLVTAPFGDRRVFNGKLQSQHYGTDLDGKTGDEITSANDGVVVMARECYASGGTVLVHHGADLFTAYFHMSRIDVKPGDKVKRGQHLGLVGKTGRVTGPHLHWAVKVNGMYVDAESLMRLDFEN